MSVTSHLSDNSDLSILDRQSQHSTTILFAHPSSTKSPTRLISLSFGTSTWTRPTVSRRLTDVCCRCTVAGETKYYIRNIKNTFVVGQTYPVQAVPGPHSRQNTNLTKLRLQSIAFRLLNKNSNSRLKVNQLTKYFPDQNDLQMRQRLKVSRLVMHSVIFVLICTTSQDFMEFNRKEPDQGYWTVKKTFNVPDEAELMKQATPELVCLTESMQVGSRHLQDAGYGQVEEGGAGDDDSKLDIEQQLAPWITTKNFINATSNKAMLKLFGEGDPTGRGEAFSFLRVSMKDIFLRDGELMSARLGRSLPLYICCGISLMYCHL